MKMTSFILIGLAIGAAIGALTSCAGLTFTASSPWGDVFSVDGNTIITAKPVIFEK